MVDTERDTTLAQAVRLREESKRDEAREKLLALAERYPDDAEIAYQTAWVHDTLGLEAEAARFYERALATDGLSAEDRLGVFLGLGSTYRVLGRYQEALKTFKQGLEEYPGDKGLRTFQSMALYNVGDAREAVSKLLKLVVEGQVVPEYGRAISYYADNLDEIIQMNESKGCGAAYLLVWRQEFGGGRPFYTALGDSADA